LIKLTVSGAELHLIWPSSDISPLIPQGRDHFVDRSYWEDVKLDRDGSGHIVRLHYGQFEGRALGPQP
jgi:hypothetical protein